MRLKNLFLVILLSCVTVPALAGKSAEDSIVYQNYPNLRCPMTENSQININFNTHEDNLDNMKNIMDEKIKMVEELASEIGIEVIELQSMNYNVNINNYNTRCSPACEGNSYQLSGNMNFIVFPSKKATELIVLLNKKGYNGNLNVNMYRQCR